MVYQFKRDCGFFLWIYQSLLHEIWKITAKIRPLFKSLYLFNTLWPSDTIWPHISGSASVHVAACCLTLRSHHLNECRLLVCEILCHFIANAQGTVLYDTGRVLVWCIVAFRHHEYCIFSMGFTLPAFTMKHHLSFNSSRSSAAYMRRWTGLASIQVMACRLIGAKALSEPCNADLL